MEITIAVDEAVLTRATRRAFEESFSAPQYHDRNGGEGYESVKGQVSKFVMTLDVSEQIKAAASNVVAAVVRDVLTVELKKHVQVVARQMRQEGTLFKPDVLAGVEEKPK